MKSFAGKTALVTGASSGIGLALARDLAERGARVIVVARSRDRLNALAAELRSVWSCKAEAIALDLAAPGAAATLAHEVEIRGLQVDVLVNNAGFGKWGAFMDTSVAEYAEMVDLNIQAVVELTHTFLPGMLARRDGAILNVGSTGSYVPVPWSAVYAATKAFVLSFSEALYYECQGKGVQVTALCPGATESNFAAVAHAGVQAGGDGGEAPEAVAKVGLDALLKGECSVISGKSNRQMAFLPRLLPRRRAVAMVGQAWKRRLQSRGISV